MQLRNSKFSLLGVLVGFVMLFPISAGAIPSLIVAPGSPNDSAGDIYFGDAERYLAVFADGGFVSGQDGFMLQPSGGMLTVVYGSNNGKAPTDEDIILATNAAGAAGLDGGFSFDGKDFLTVNEGGDQIDGYGPPPYYGVNLFSPDDSPDPDSKWVSFIDPAFKGTWFTYTAEFVYDDFVGGDWVFAWRNTINPGITFNNSERFSPKTTSSTVPEPATMLLVGTGLVGLAGFRRKFRK